MLCVARQRIVVRIEISPEAKDAVDKYVSEEEMTQTAVLSRVYEFFGSQPEIMRDWMLGKVRPEVKEATLQKIIEHFQRQLPYADDPTPEEEEEDEQESESRAKRRKRAG